MSQVTDAVVTESFPALESGSIAPTVAAVALLPKPERLASLAVSKNDTVQSQEADSLTLVAAVQEDGDDRNLLPLSNLPSYAVFAFMAAALCAAAIVVLWRDRSAPSGGPSGSALKRRL
jgi:hypothetical protein